MGRLSAVLRSVGGGGLAFWCAGCREIHVVWTGEGNGPRWAWNGDPERPVFSPSIRVSGTQCVRDETGRWTGEWKRDAAGNPLPRVCHSFIGCNGAQPGQITYLGDCTHDLAGRTIDLPPVPSPLEAD